MDTFEDTLSEYEEARKRFKFYTKNENNSIEVQELDELVFKLCEGKSLDLPDFNTFFELIYHADYLLLKDEVKPMFYKALCDNYIFNNNLNDIIDNLDKLNGISHVKCELFYHICNIFGVFPSSNENVLNLVIKQEREFEYTEITKIIIEPIAFKVMSCKENFKLAHLNLIFKFFENVEEIGLRQCNLNGKDVENLFRNLKLKKLDLSECGTSVNKIIQINSFEYLKELNISYNPIRNDILEKIRDFQLENLIAINCFMKSGKFIDEIWVSDTFKVKNQSEDAKTDVNILWEGGVLKGTLKSLNIGNCSISNENLEEFSNLPLIHLDITKCLKLNGLKLVFPNSLQELKIKGIDLKFEHLLTIFQLNNLSVLDMNFSPEKKDDFTSLTKFPAFKKLIELSVTLSEFNENFFDFISKLKLEKFEFETDDTDPFPFEIFFNYTDERKTLTSLSLLFPCMEINNEILQGMRKLKLKKLSFSLAESFDKFADILTCENIQQSLSRLDLFGKEICDDDLLALCKFEKLENISFEFTNNLNAKLLEEFLNKKCLKKIDLTANVHGLFDLEMAKLMCIAHVRKVNIYDDYSRSISIDALEFLSNPVNLSKFSKNSKILYLRTKLKKEFAAILKNVSWEHIYLDNSHFEDDSFDILMNNENLHYSLDRITVVDTSELDIISKTLKNIHLSYLEIQLPTISNKDSFENILTGCISKSLRILTIELCNVPVDIFQTTNLSIIHNFLEYILL